MSVSFNREDPRTVLPQLEKNLNGKIEEVHNDIDEVHNDIDNVQKEVDLLKADYVVEQGTDGIWTYRKWASGVAECWGTYAANFAVNTASAVYGGYRSAEIVTGTFPFTFITTNVMSATTTTGGQGAWVNNIRNVNNSAHFYLSAGSSLATGDRGVYIYIKGTWK